jgi:hypothetical protein
MSLHRVILLERRLCLTRVLYGADERVFCMERTNACFVWSGRTRVLYGADERVFCMERTNACFVWSGRTKQLFHSKTIATIDAIEHVLNVANTYLAHSME